MLTDRISWRAREVKATALAFCEEARTLRRGRPVVHYLGAVRRGPPNLGDEAIFRASVAQLSESQVIPLSRGAGPRVLRRRLDVLAPSHAMPAAVVLGGGTLVGRYGWKEEVALALKRAPAGNAFMFGVGVEDPAFEHAGFTNWKELSEWTTLLLNFANVNVRGRLSAETLAQFGIHARVVGDPALILGQPDSDRSYCPERIVINVGRIGGVWGGRPAQVIGALHRLAKRLEERGYDIVVVALQRDDHALAKKFVRDLSRRAQLCFEDRDPYRMMTLFADSSVVVAYRLHAAVLATAMAVPTMLVDYRTKCLDYMSSLGQEHLAFRSDRLDVAALERAVVSLSDSRRAKASELEMRVREKQRLLQSEFARARTSVREVIAERAGWAM